MLRPPSLDDAQQQVLGADELVFQPLGFGFGSVGHFAKAGRGRRLRASVCGGLLRQFAAQAVGDGLRLDAHLAQQSRNNPVGLFSKREQQMLGVDLGVIALFGEPLRRQNRFLRLFGVLVQVHRVSRYAADLLPTAPTA